MEKRTHSVTPETDDFAARYDRMVAEGPGWTAIKAVVGLIGLLALVAVLGFLLGA